MPRDDLSARDDSYAVDGDIEDLDGNVNPELVLERVATLLRRS